MAFSQKQKMIYTIGVLLVVVLVGMHILTGIKGYQYFEDVVKPKAQLAPFPFNPLSLLTITYKEYEARLLMLIIVAGLTLLTNLASIWLLNQPSRINWLKHLVVFNLVIEVGMGLLLAISVFEMSITRGYYIDSVYPSEDYANKVWDNDGFNTFWKILIANTCLTFVPQVAFLIYFYVGVTSNVSDDSKDIISNDSSSYNRM